MGVLLRQVTFQAMAGSVTAYCVLMLFRPKRGVFDEKNRLLQKRGAGIFRRCEEKGRRMAIPRIRTKAEKGYPSRAEKRMQHYRRYRQILNCPVHSPIATGFPLVPAAF